MTWAVVISIILISLVKILMTCLPTGVVEWLTSKFETHSKLNDALATVTLDGKHLDRKEKTQIINYLNEATFLERHYIWPGNEHLYLNPENGGTPIIIDSKRGKKDVRLFVFRYNDHIDVVKQYKKKVVAYSLLSDSLQKRSMITG
ncbi:YfmQ family protein [Neobacillus sp. PS3-34]|uniref:YfmQ family protein n=1 Tax=Neobacillus sp. PS3-34 TaxID=3070678 RepID=UPI0027E0526D|nr:YfmQ family protein [Neobacillus sp. PS3-34]WML46743.1 YfmQ family protein [Neobacillus sp. PS3-34]